MMVNENAWYWYLEKKRQEGWFSRNPEFKLIHSLCQLWFDFNGMKFTHTVDGSEILHQLRER